MFVSVLIECKEGGQMLELHVLCQSQTRSFISVCVKQKIKILIAYYY
jgi:hypothetical protein